jgi:hypothetical protein
VADLAAVDVLAQHAEALLQRRLGIDPVQVVQVDRVGPQRAQALLDLGAEDLGATLAGAVAALGGDEDVAGVDPVERGTDRLLARAARVQVGGVDVPHAGGDRLADEGDVLAGGGQPVGPEADAGDLVIGESQRGHARRG